MVVVYSLTIKEPNPKAYSKAVALTVVNALKIITMEFFCKNTHLDKASIIPLPITKLEIIHIQKRTIRAALVLLLKDLCNIKISLKLNYRKRTYSKAETRYKSISASSFG